MKNELTYKSQDNITDIHAVIWTPTLPVKAIVQMSHGMIEHIERYDNLAQELNKYGILFCGNDHLGHGLSVVDKDHYGYFAAKNSDKILVDDVHTLTTKMKEQYPTVPYFLIGHSMGSFIARNYMQHYSEDIDGAIIVGSGYKSQITMIIGKIIVAVISFYNHGSFYRSKFLHKLTTGNFAKKFEDGEKNPDCWLTTNEKILKDFANDQLSKFNFTCNAYSALFTLLKNACNKSKNKTIRKNLPILILSGKDDPVGDFGKGLYKIEKLYKKTGLNDITIKQYNGMRHEVLNEKEKIFVINDILQFINTKSLLKK